MSERKEQPVQTLGLYMKYFILVPGNHSMHGVASRAALRAYASTIRSTNQRLADDLLEWADTEEYRCFASGLTEK